MIGKQGLFLVSEPVRPWEEAALVYDSIQNLVNLGGIKFRWARQPANEDAHGVASLAFKKKLS